MMKKKVSTLQIFITIFMKTKKNVFSGQSKKLNIQKKLKMICKYIR